MARQEWLKGGYGLSGQDMEAWKGKGGEGRLDRGWTGHCVEFWGVFCLMSGMARMDWGGWGSATHGEDMEKKGEGRRLRKDGQGEE